MKARAGFVVSAVVAILVLEFAGAVPSGAMPRTIPAGPVYIYNVYDLQNMSKDLDGTYELANDIDASSTSTWNGGQGFAPVGDDVNLFNGTFDGKGHKITGLFIDRHDTGAGLFGVAGPISKISNVTLVDINITGDHSIGGLASENQGNVFNCIVDGQHCTINGVNPYHNEGGGLVGANWGTITNCALKGSVVGIYPGLQLGGLVGFTTVGLIKQCTNLGSVKGGDFTGGLVSNLTGRMSGCANLGSVSGDHHVGGLAAWGFGKIDNCSNSGNVSGTDMVGGIFGIGGDVTNSENSGVVSGLENSTGGIVGENLDAIILFCKSTGRITGHNQTGGIAGTNLGVIDRCWSSGSVNGTTAVGGLAGRCDNDLSFQIRKGMIYNSYSQSSVEGYEMVGGLIGGWHGSGGNITCSYSAGHVNGTELTGGLAGENVNGMAIGSYWDNETSGWTTSAAGSGRDTAAMFRKATFTIWDFNAIWDIVEGKGYPFLRALPPHSSPDLTHPPVWTDVPSDTVLNAGDSYSFAASATDVDPGDTVTYGLTGTTQLPIGMSIATSTGAISWPVATLGEYSLNLTATDGKYTIRHPFKLTVVEGSPNADNNTVIVSPANNSEVSGVVNVTARVRACFCLGVTQLHVDGAFVCNGTGYDNPQTEFEWFYHLWNSSAVQDGRHKITVLGKHPEYSDTVYVTVNNTPLVPVTPAMPVITGVQGPNNTRVNATESVTFRADAVNPDGGQLSYEWKENGITIATGPSFTQKFPPGNHTLVLNIGDGLHYVNRTISFVVSPKPKPTEPEPSVPGFGALAVVTAIAGVFAAGLFWRRERR